MLGCFQKIALLLVVRPLHHSGGLLHHRFLHHQKHHHSHLLHRIPHLPRQTPLHLRDRRQTKILCSPKCAPLNNNLRHLLSRIPNHIAKRHPLHHHRCNLVRSSLLPALHAIRISISAIPRPLYHNLRSPKTKMRRMAWIFM